MTSERYLEMARRWFTEGWRGDLPMAEEIFSADLRTNGVHVVGISTLQDQFGLLKQIGYLPNDVRAT
jgi:hypothetical protein